MSSSNVCPQNVLSDLECVAPDCRVHYEITRDPYKYFSNQYACNYFWGQAEKLMTDKQRERHQKLPWRLKDALIDKMLDHFQKRVTIEKPRVETFMDEQVYYYVDNLMWCGRV